MEKNTLTLPDGQGQCLRTSTNTLYIFPLISAFLAVNFVPEQLRGLNSILADQTVLQAKGQKSLYIVLIDPVRDIILIYVIPAYQFFHVIFMCSFSLHNKTERPIG